MVGESREVDAFTTSSREGSILVIGKGAVYELYPTDGDVRVMSREDAVAADVVPELHITT